MKVFVVEDFSVEEYLGGEFSKARGVPEGTFPAGFFCRGVKENPFCGRIFFLPVSGFV